MKGGTDERWQAVCARDRRADGSFFYGVLTTGVFCRPSCSSRLPKRENVRFYASAEEAERDGLRACKRCKPVQQVDAIGTRMRELCAFIDAHPQETLTLEELAGRVELTPFHLQRQFKAVVGVSPKQYLDNARLRGFKAALRDPEAGDVTGAIFDAGYGSLSRLYEKLDTRLGMTPMEYRGGGAGVEISWAAAQTPLGLMMMGATNRGLCFVQFGESERELLGELVRQYPRAVVTAMGEPAPAGFREWMESLNEYLAGRRPDVRLPVHVQGTAFQLMVWNFLQKIPAGQVASYQEVARGIGRPTAVRAVARACASNTVAVAIPCHRVIRGTGEMGGYRWGVGRKRTLLGVEARAAAGGA